MWREWGIERERVRKLFSGIKCKIWYFYSAADKLFFSKENMHNLHRNDILLNFENLIKFIVCKFSCNLLFYVTSPSKNFFVFFSTQSDLRHICMNVTAQSPHSPSLIFFSSQNVMRIFHILMEKWRELGNIF